MHEEVLDRSHWDEQYEEGDLPWDTQRPEPELLAVLERFGVAPGRALEVGCGTGVNAVCLAERGFATTATDLSERALAHGRRRAEEAGATVEFLSADVTDPSAPLGGPFDFVFDRGCYHAVRLTDGPGYVRAVERLTRPGALVLILAGNADEPEDDVGPPTLSGADLVADWERAAFEIVHLRRFRFDAPRGERNYLGWSCLARRKG